MSSTSEFKLSPRGSRSRRAFQRGSFVATRGSQAATQRASVVSPSGSQQVSRRGSVVYSRGSQPALRRGYNGSPNRSNGRGFGRGSPLARDSGRRSPLARGSGQGRSNFSDTVAPNNTQQASVTPVPPQMPMLNAPTGNVFPPGFNPLLLPVSVRQLPYIAAYTYGNMSANYQPQSPVMPINQTPPGLMLPPPGLVLPQREYPLEPPGLPSLYGATNPMFIVMTNPPENQRQHFVPRPDCRPSNKLVMEQIRHDQGIRVPFGWDEVAETWVRLQNFQNGFPTWPSHVFWGKFTNGAGEVVQVAEGRQLFYYKQYKFWENVENLYLQEMTSPIEPHSTISTEFSGSVEKPLFSPWNVSGEPICCRVPEKEEYLPTDAFPCFVPVHQRPEDTFDLHHFDIACEKFFKEGIISQRVPKFAPGDDYRVPEYKSFAAYSKVIIINEKLEEVVEPEESPIPVAESESVLFTALEHSCSQMDIKTAKDKDHTSESDINNMPHVRTDEILCETSEPLAAAPSFSLVSIASSEKSADSGWIQVRHRKKRDVMTEIVIQVKSCRSEQSQSSSSDHSAPVQHESEDAREEVVAVQPPMISESARVALENDRMAEMLGRDVTLQGIMENIQNVWNTYCRNQRIVRESPRKIVPEEWLEVVKQMAFAVMEGDSNWKPREETARQFAESRVVAHRKSRNCRLFYLWKSILDLTPMPTELTSDICYLKTQHDWENMFPVQEAQWFDAVTTMNDVDSVLSTPADPQTLTDSNTLSEAERLYSTFTLLKNLANYCKRQQFIRKACMTIGLQALRCNSHEMDFNSVYRKVGEKWLSMSEKDKEALRKRIFTKCISKFSPLKPSHSPYVRHTYEVIHYQLLNSDNPVIFFDAYVIDMKLRAVNLKKTSTQDSKKMFALYLESVFGTVEAPDAELINKFVNIPLPYLGTEAAARIDKEVQRNMNYYINRQKHLRVLCKSVPLERLGMDEMESELTVFYTNSHDSFSTGTKEQKVETQKYVFYVFFYGVYLDFLTASTEDQYRIAISFKMLRESSSEVIIFDAFSLAMKMGAVNALEWPKIAAKYYKLVFAAHEAKLEVERTERVITQLAVNADKDADKQGPAATLETNVKCAADNEEPKDSKDSSL